MKKRYLLLLVISAMILGGCSYNQVEDELRSKWNGSDTEKTEISGRSDPESGAADSDGSTSGSDNILPDEDGSAGAAAAEEKKSWDDLQNDYAADPAVHSGGDVVRSEYTGMQFQIRKSEVFGSYEDSGLPTEEVKPSDMLVPYLTGETPADFVVVTVYAERVGQHVMGEAGIPKINYETIIDPENYQPPDHYEGFEPAYFSGHPEEFDEDNYCNIGLAVGEAAEYQVGYFVPKELTEKDKMVWCVDYPTDRQKYIALEVRP